MIKRLLTPALVAALGFSMGCAGSEPLAPEQSDRVLLQRVPADGNKIVTPIDFTIPGFTTCGDGTMLDLHIVGWIQDRPGSDPPHQPGIVTFYFDFIFSNAAGETYVWHQVGGERFYTDRSGDFVVSIAGRTLDLVGRLVFNIDTGKVDFVAGRQPFVDDQVCAALT
jgi:hypothetical protein